MYYVFVPVVVSKRHVVRNGIGKALFLFGVFFFQSLIDHQFQVFTQVRELGVTLWVRHWIGLSLVGFLLRNRIGTIHVQFEIGNIKKVIPEFMTEVFYIL